MSEELQNAVERLESRLSAAAVNPPHLRDIRTILTALAEHQREVEVYHALIHRMQVVQQDPEYIGVWQCYAVHGGNYKDGPKWEKEFTAAQDVMNAAAKKGIQ